MAQSWMLWKFSILVIVSCLSADAYRAPFVCLKREDQCLRGTTLTTLEDTEYEAFFGVPFAKPPVGKLRFANPVSHDPWKGTYLANEPKDSCIQRNVYLPDVDDVFGSEDCLYLNIYRPKDIQNALPVMIFIHGGGFYTGSASPLIVGPDKFMDKENVILVVLQYRLGALGFLSTNDSVIPGNYGLKDQAMAIRWVKKHIHRFGGNTDLVTLFGQNVGGLSAQLHMMSPLSRGQFSRAILMSGTAMSDLSNFDKEQFDSLHFARQQMAALGYRHYKSLSSKEILSELRRCNAYELVKSVDALEYLVGPAYAQTLYRPVIEKYEKGQSFLSDSPLKIWESGNYEQIPWMIGQVPNEGIIYSADTIKSMADPEVWSQISPQFPALLTTGIGMNISEAPLLKARFFRRSSDMEWITRSNINRLSDLITEEGFTYPALLAVRAQFKHRHHFSAPVSMYYFNFTGPYSMSKYLLPGDKRKFGICHGDDLIYLFNEAALFPPFEKRSPEWEMSRKLVEFFVDFAYYGTIGSDLNGSCRSYRDCEMIVFRNAKDSENPVKIKRVKAFNTKLLAFWNLLFN